MAYLKFGTYQAEGFIVITGEIGAGKTTLIRSLLAGLDRRQIVAAQIVNTQLDTCGLLHAICTAYGIATEGTPSPSCLPRSRPSSRRSCRWVSGRC